MTASEQAVQVSRKEVAERLLGTATVEHYEVPVFVRRSRPQAGAGVRITRLDCAPANIDAAVEEFRNTAVPGIMDMSGLCSAQMMADRTTGRCMVATTWDDMNALAASRSGTARLRASMAAVTHLQVRSVEEYKLVFSSVRDGDTRSLIERDIELWNARDREGWLAGLDLHRLNVQAPGGIRLTGREAAETIWNMYHDAFPDNRLQIAAIHADGRGGVHEGRAVGTHTGALRGPAGEIAPTGRRAEIDFCGVYEFEEGKITSFHLYFDRGRDAPPARRHSRRVIEPLGLRERPPPGSRGRAAPWSDRAPAGTRQAPPPPPRGRPAEEGIGNPREQRDRRTRAVTYRAPAHGAPPPPPPPPPPP